jgi:C-terminus of AA_permease
VGTSFCTILRIIHRKVERPFKAPFVFYVAPFGVLSAGVLMFGLPAETWLSFAIWLVIGLAIYFLYDRHHSQLARHQKGKKLGSSNSHLFFGATKFSRQRGSVVNAESLIKILGQARDRRELNAEVIRNPGFRLTQCELNADLRRAACAIACSRNSIISAMKQPVRSLATS